MFIDLLYLCIAFDLIKIVSLHYYICDVFNNHIWYVKSDNVLYIASYIEGNNCDNMSQPVTMYIYLQYDKTLIGFPHIYSLFVNR